MPEPTVEEILRDHFWLCVQNPREVPRKGGPFPRGSMAKVLREWMRANPEAQITVVTLHEWGPDFWHGPEQLEMLDRRSSPFARRHNAAVDAARLRAQPPADTQDGWQQDFNAIGIWADSTFGPATVRRRLERAGEELAEALDAPTDKVMEEIADVVICLAAAAHSHGGNLEAAILRKMSINRARQWSVRGDGTGYHISQAAAPSSKPGDAT